LITASTSRFSNKSTKEPCREKPLPHAPWNPAPSAEFAKKTTKVNGPLHQKKY